MEDFNALYCDTYKAALFAARLRSFYPADERERLQAHNLEVKVLLSPPKIVALQFLEIDLTLVLSVSSLLISI